MKAVRSFIKTASLTELEKAQQLINDAISKYTQQTIEWTGRGRRPKAFEGVDIEKFLA